MASIVYNSMLEDLVSGSINFGSDSFKCLLVTSSYQANKDTHTKRSDVDNETSGTGYTTGGTTVTATVAKNVSTDRVTVSFSNPSWPTASISAAGAVIYKSRGGASSADELVVFIDLGGTVSSTTGTFSVTFSTALTFQN